MLGIGAREARPDSHVLGQGQLGHEPAELEDDADPREPAATPLGLAQQVQSLALEPNLPGIGSDDAGAHDLRLLLSHAAGVGDLLDVRTTRAAMLIRLNQLAAAGSGIPPRFPQALEHALREGALPEVHITGTIGTGDLTALAEIALTLIGRRPWAHGHLPPIAIGAGDALAFISSSAVTLARAVLAWAEER